MHGISGNCSGGTMYQKNKTKGVTIVEYAIALALIAIAIVAAAPGMTSAVVGVFNEASSVLNK
jgi:Flp pilus assembly pilin Flp